MKELQKIKEINEALNQLNESIQKVSTNYLNLISFMGNTKIIHNVANMKESLHFCLIGYDKLVHNRLIRESEFCSIIKSAIKMIE